MYSVRMRASQNEKHISGAERIVDEREIKNIAQLLVERGLSHERGKPDFINISVEELKIPLRSVTSLPVTLINAGNATEGKNAARKILEYLQIPVFCIERAFSLLERESMRGAIIMNLEGKRLEPDKQRGVRASRMDITEDAVKELACALAAEGLSWCYAHTSEALVLATKVASVKGAVAELCWSDDPSYTAGYVASKKLGYLRISHLKPEGVCRGGRVFFVDNIDLDTYINEIEKLPVMVNKFAGIHDNEEIYRRIK